MVSISNTVYYILFILGFLGLVVSLEWDKISKMNTPNPKQIAVILIILFFLGTGLASLFR